MQFFKKNIKTIIGFIVGVVLASSTTVFAYSYFAGDVKYTKKGEDGTEIEISVEQALNELYNRNENGNGEGDVIVDNLEKLTDGVAFDNDYFYIYTPNEIKWNETELENLNYEKIIYCHKASGNNSNFLATLPFSLDGKTLEVKLIKEIGNYGWNPYVRSASGNQLDIDANYGDYELSEYYFFIGVK